MRTRKRSKKLSTSSESLQGRLRANLQQRLPQIRFLATVVILMGTYYALTGTDAFSKKFLPAYLTVVASVTSAALSLLGFVTVTSGTVVSSTAFSMNIAYGCDALEPTFLFMVVVAAYPSAWKSKLLGMITGSLLLYATNIVRLVSLFWTGTYKREYFEIMHIEVWQAVFIVLALALFVVWVSLAERHVNHEAV
ncbi:MAG: archaeosortase/exosortase family protein [Candidatus Kapaibacterium sp.]